MARRHGAGFSMVELVVTISIIGLLAAFTIPRFVSIEGFDSRGFHDEAIGVVRYAQKTAIAWRRTVFICVSATEIRVGTASGCAVAIVHPTKESGRLTATAPSGVALASVPEFSFNGIGRPSAATTITFSSTIAGDPPRRIVVEAETGYVHP